jgi:chloride channel 3/4/5
MPKSIASYHSLARSSRDGDGYYDEDDVDPTEQHDTYSSTTPTSPTTSRRLRPNRTSDLDLRGRFPTEQSSLLGYSHGPFRSYTSLSSSVPGTPRHYLARHNSQNPTASTRLRHHSRVSSFSMRLVNALGSERRQALGKC